MFSLWIYQRRPACAARMQHGGSSSVLPAQEEAAEEGLQALWAVASADPALTQDDNVLPFQSPRETASADSAGRSGRKPRGRPKGRTGG